MSEFSNREEDENQNKSPKASALLDNAKNAYDFSKRKSNKSTDISDGTSSKKIPPEVSPSDKFDFSNSLNNLSKQVHGEPENENSNGKPSQNQSKKKDGEKSPKSKKDVNSPTDSLEKNSAIDSNKLKNGGEAVSKAALKAGEAASTTGKAAATGGLSLAFDAAKKAITTMGKLIKKASKEKDSFESDIDIGFFLRLIAVFLVFCLIMGGTIHAALTPHIIKDFSKDDVEKRIEWEYDSKAIKEKKALNKVFKNYAYKAALKEAKKKCKEDDKDWKKSKKTLKKTNSDSWKKVYKKVNYLDAISAICLAENSLDFHNFDIDEHTEFIKSEDVYKNLYFIDYEDADDHYKITIRSYSLYNLGKMIDEGMDIYDPYVVDSKESFFDHLDLTRQQIKGVLGEEAYKELNVDVETPKYPVLDGETLEGLGDEYDSLDMGEFDTSEWYSDVPVEATGSGNLSKTENDWLDLYDAPTCASTSDSYYVNLAVIRNDVAAKIAEVVNNVSISTPPASWSSLEFYTPLKDGSPRKLQGVTWEVGKGGTAQKNGRYLIACGPGLVSRNYYANTAGIGMTSQWYSYGKKQIDLVVQEKESGATYYIPVTTGDAKAHSYPFGVIQTGIHTPRTISEQLYGSDFHTDSAIKGFGTAEYTQSAMNAYSSLLKEYTGYTMYQWETHGAIEWCALGPNQSTCKARNNYLISKYNLLGAIVY